MKFWADVITWAFTAYNIGFLVRLFRRERRSADRFEAMTNIATTAIERYEKMSPRNAILEGFADALAYSLCMVRGVYPLRPEDGCGKCPTCQARNVRKLLEERGL